MCSLSTPILHRLDWFRILIFDVRFLSRVSLDVSDNYSSSTPKNPSVLSSLSSKPPYTTSESLTFAHMSQIFLWIILLIPFRILLENLNLLLDFPWISSGVHPLHPQSAVKDVGRTIFRPDSWPTLSCPSPSSSTFPELSFDHPLSCESDVSSQSRSSEGVIFTRSVREGISEGENSEGGKDGRHTFPFFDYLIIRFNHLVGSCIRVFWDE